MRAVVALVALAAGCQVTGTYHCTADSQCARGSNTGFCEKTGFCSFADTSCDTQHRYDSSAGSGLDSTCVETIVTGYYRQRFATNDASFMPTVVEAPPPATAALTVTLDDGTQPKVRVAADGHFTFDLAKAGQAYRLVVDGLEYQLAAPHLELAIVSAGRPDRKPVTGQLIVSVTTLGTVGGTDGLATTGLWAVLDTGNNNSGFNVDWQGATSLSGALGLLDASQHDQLFVTKRTNTNGVTTLVGYGTENVTLQNGINTFLPNVPIGQTTDECRELTAPLGDYATRLATLGAGGMPVWLWAIQAVPAPNQLSLAGAQTLATQSAASAPTNIDTPQTFGNPFPGTTLLAVASAELSYPFAMMGVPGGNLTATVTRAGTFATGASCADQKPALALTGAIAGEASVGGTAVTADDQIVMVDKTKTTQITWKLAVPGEIGAFRIDLFEVTNDGSRTSLAMLHSFETIAPALALAPATLVSGHTYVFGISSSRTYAMAASGDFVTPTLPIESAYTYSHSFAVQ